MRIKKFLQVLKQYFCNDLQIGPEKGVTHLATAAIINALWDLWAKIEGKVKKVFIERNFSIDLILRLRMKFLL